VRRKGDTSENLIEILERRLDAVTYRLKFAVTPFAARQFVSHGHLLVNGRRVNIPSYLVKDNDTIEVKERSKQLAVVLDATQSSERDVPEYLEVDHRAMKGRFARAPKLSDVPYPVQMSQTSWSNSIRDRGGCFLWLDCYAWNHQGSQDGSGLAERVSQSECPNTCPPAVAMPISIMAFCRQPWE